jgi:hypothetical protein
LLFEAARLRTLALTRSQRCCSKRRTFWAESFVAFWKPRVDSFVCPSSAIVRAGAIGGADRCNTLAMRSSPVERRRCDFLVPPILASFTVAIFIGAAFRYARRTSTALPDECVWRKISSFLKCFARRRSWVFLYCPSQVCSRGWVRYSISGDSGPRVGLRASHSTSIYFRRGDSIAEAMSPGMLWRSTSGL